MLGFTWRYFFNQFSRWALSFAWCNEVNFAQILIYMRQK